MTDGQIEMSDVRGRGCTIASLEQVSCLKELLWSIVEEGKVFISGKEMSYEFIPYHCLSVKQMGGECEDRIDISQLQATECITIYITPFPTRGEELPIHSRSRSPVAASPHDQMNSCQK